MKPASADRAMLERRYLRMLQIDQFQRRPAGWRFGTRKIADSVVERLVANGRAGCDAKSVWLIAKENTR